jgi:two-component system alkaline phosphatase synthesis response regulator PhoP
MKRRIVIADDDPTIISLVSLRLGLARFEVLSATNGREALDLIRKSEPLAVILDVRMPEWDGLAALDRIKSDPDISNLPVLMLSGERDSQTVMSAMGAGASDYIVKPFNPDRLLERVNRMVKSSAMVWSSEQSTTTCVWEL